METTNFDQLCNELRKCEVIIDENKIIFNGFKEPRKYEGFLQPLINDVINNTFNNDFKFINNLYRRWNSIEPVFNQTNDGINNIIFHRELKVTNNDVLSIENIHHMIHWFVRIQFNTFKKVNNYLENHIDYLKNNFEKEEKNSGIQVNDLNKNRYYKTRYQFASFKLNNEDIIKDFFDILVKRKFINDDYKSFERIFTGLQPKKQVIWKDSIEQLNYLITQLKENNIIQDYKRSKPNLISVCFSSDKDDFFTPEQINNTHRPKDTDVMDGIISSLEYLESD